MRSVPFLHFTDDETEILSNYLAQGGQKVEMELKPKYL